MSKHAGGNLQKGKCFLLLIFLISAGSTIEAVKLSDVNTIYAGENTPALENVNLNVAENAFVSILGPNAAGKTTLLETIMGLLPSKGEKIVLGKDLDKHGRELRCAMGYVPQDFDVYSSMHFLVKDTVMMGRYGKIGLLNSPSKSDKEKVFEAMRLVGIEDLAKRPIGKLSGGQRQRVFIARALAKEPRILLLDEPLSSIDLGSQKKIMGRILNAYDEGSLTIFMVTHELTRVSERTDLLLVMNGGRIILQGPPEEVRHTELFHNLYGVGKRKW